MRKVCVLELMDKRKHKGLVTRLVTRSSLGGGGLHPKEKKVEGTSRTYLEWQSCPLTWVVRSFNWGARDHAKRVS